MYTTSIPRKASKCHSPKLIVKSRNPDTKIQPVSRYRPPAPASTALITAEGFDTLQQEQKALWVRRKGVTEAVTAAAAEGDRSENAEYIYRKKELREIDRRIRYLQKRLSGLKVVREHPSTPDKIYFGAWVELSDEEGTESKVRIVGPDEIDPSQHWISIDSVVARALLKKEEGDEVLVKAPGGETIYIVESISYQGG